MVNLRHQGRKAERAKRDMAGVAGQASKCSLKLRALGMAATSPSQGIVAEGETPSSRPNPSTLDLTIALLTGIIVVGVIV